MTNKELKEIKQLNRLIGECRGRGERQKANRLFKRYQKRVKFIYDIQDCFIRNIFIYRYILGMSWIKVSFSVGGGNTDSSCKMIVKRYLDRINSGK